MSFFGELVSVDQIASASVFDPSDVDNIATILSSGSYTALYTNQTPAGEVLFSISATPDIFGAYSTPSPFINPAVLSGDILAFDGRTDLFFGAYLLNDTTGVVSYQDINPTSGALLGSPVVLRTGVAFGDVGDLSTWNSERLVAINPVFDAVEGNWDVFLTTHRVDGVADSGDRSYVIDTDLSEPQRLQYRFGERAAPEGDILLIAHTDATVTPGQPRQAINFILVDDQGTQGVVIGNAPLLVEGTDTSLAYRSSEVEGRRVAVVTYLEQGNLFLTTLDLAIGSFSGPLLITTSANRLSLGSIANLSDGRFVVNWFEEAPDGLSRKQMASVVDLRTQAVVGDGTSMDDRFAGTIFDDIVNGLEGNDEARGAGGNDLFTGGLGDDVGHGDAGDDILRGDEGNDQLFGGAGNDDLDGGADNDRLSGGSGNNRLDGGAGSGDRAIFDGRVDQFDFTTSRVAGFDLKVTDTRVAAETGDNEVTGIELFEFTDQTLTLAEVALLAEQRQVNTDFSGDGIDDILWRNATAAQVRIWDMEAGGIRGTTINPGVASSAWEIQGMGDFSGDGTSDILWRNSNGQTLIWDFEQGGSRGPSLFPGTISTNWEIQGTSDFTGDGVDDLVWRNSNGEMLIWDFEQGGTRGPSLFPGFVPNSWQIRGTGDFTGDGVDDLVWRNQTTGQVLVWEFDEGGSRGASLFPGTVSTAWQIQGTGDFTGDGIDDLVWRRPSGEMLIWDFEQGGSRGASLFPGVISTGWQIQGVGDYSSDGTDDIIWRNKTSGQTLIWDLEQGGTRAPSLFPGTASTAWDLEASPFHYDFIV